MVAQGVALGARLAAAAVLMLAGMAALVLHVWILPRINEFRPYLETNATHVLGLPVRIGGMRSDRRGWQPEIELRDVQFHDAAGNAALQVERIQAVVSLETLARRGFCPPDGDRAAPSGAAAGRWPGADCRLAA